jgi:hypothetical protein
MTPTEHPAGWHVDPDDATRYRWWDGNEWTDQYRSIPTTTMFNSQPTNVPSRRRLLPRWRKMTWVVVLWCVGMAIVTLATAGHAHNAVHCSPYTPRSICEGAQDANAGISFVLLFVIWIWGFIISGIAWLITRPGRRLCPVCGTQVKRGHTACGDCGHDFAAAARQRLRTP